MRTRIGEVLGSKYRLDEELGRGGMGAVYRAFHLGVHKEFAVKVLTSASGSNSGKSTAARLVLEAQAASRIGHPGILDVYDVGEDADGRPFLVMELLHGETLASLIARGPLPVADACWLAMQVLEILEAAHAAGVVHRDVKPQNVFLVARSEKAGAGPRTVKLLDFGIAKFRLDDATGITGSGEVIGSPLYLAPEQAHGEVEVDARADVWSVGATLFEMLTGKPAHIGASAISVLAKILTEVAPLASSRRSAIPTAVDAVVARALAISRDDRYASAREMLEALEAVRAELAWDARAPSFDAATPRSARSPAPSEHAEGGPSSEPAMGSAVTAGTAPARRSRLHGVVLAAVTLGLGALLPWLVWGAGAASPAATARKAAEPPARAPAIDAAVAAKEVAAARAEPFAGEVGTPAALSLAVSSLPPASAVTPRGPRPANAGVDSKPSCGEGEVLSLGHCCPRGHVWQSERCERPLATSF